MSKNDGSHCYEAKTHGPFTLKNNSHSSSQILIGGVASDPHVTIAQRFPSE